MQQAGQNLSSVRFGGWNSWKRHYLHFIGQMQACQRVYLVVLANLPLAIDFFIFQNYLDEKRGADIEFLRE